MPEWVRRAATAINQLAQHRLNVVSKSAAHTVADGDDMVICDATSAAFTVTLPSVASFAGKQVIIKKVDASANAVTVDANGSETIDGATTQSLAAQYDSVTLVAGPSEWHLI